MSNPSSSPAKTAPPPDPADDPYHVIVVDDSAVIRTMITRALEGQAGIKVAGTASNGQLAIDMLKRRPVDVVILDIEMPVMDGLAAIPQLKAIDPGVQIVMASTLTQRNADISIRALQAGATDYIPKPTADELGALTADFNRELIEKVRTLGAVARRKGVRRRPAAGVAVAKPSAVPEKKPVTLRPMPVMHPDVIAIGSSTGGPQALFQVIAGLGSGLPQPVVITQHMPPSFTAILAEHIARQCKVICAEARDGDILKPGHYYVAPGDFHMLIVKKPEGAAVKLSKDAPENFCRPAVDPMLRSLVEVFGKKVLAVILTGMGSDGCKGCEAVVQAGGGVVAQDEATSVVWGMPAAVAHAGICSAVLPLADIGGAVKKMATRAGL